MRESTAAATTAALLLVSVLAAGRASGQDVAGDHAASDSATGQSDSGGSTAALVPRLDAVSRALLGAPYRLGPLGEEAPPDLDPRFRLDAFDCTTYVETVLALALAPAGAPLPSDAGGTSPLDAIDLAAARRSLDRIRYTDGEPSYERRRHLIDAQWIPELVAAGLFHDVTHELGGHAARTASIDLRRRSWQRSSLARDLALPWSAIPAGRHTLPYLPWDVVDRDSVRAALPDAAVLSVVTNPDPDTPTLVIHQGLLLRAEDGGRIVRHASSLYRSVVEETLDAFLAHARARRRHETLGVNVLAIDDASSLW